MLGKIVAFVRVNGLYLLACEIRRRAGVAVRRALMSPKLQCRGLSIGPRAFIRGLGFMQIGDNFHAENGMWLEAISRFQDQVFSPRIIIGRNVSVNHWGHIAAIERIEIGDGVLIGSKVLITDHNHGSYSGPRHSHPAVPPASRPLEGGGPVIIGANVWIGDNAIILGPVRIGEGAVIAASSLVNRDVPPNTIVGGIPAQPLKCFDFSAMVWKSCEAPLDSPSPVAEQDRTNRAISGSPQAGE